MIQPAEVQDGEPSRGYLEQPLDLTGARCSPKTRRRHPREARAPCGYCHWERGRSTPLRDLLYARVRASRFPFPFWSLRCAADASGVSGARVRLRCGRGPSAGWDRIVPAASFVGEATVARHDEHGRRRLEKRRAWKIRMRKAAACGHVGGTVVRGVCPGHARIEWSAEDGEAEVVEWGDGGHVKGRGARRTSQGGPDMG
ncbi:hypothetical protein DFH08DRAFT_894858 [Mycena albidolilacea]|uniref:Uncharacterized protein n=1 Tax=Mycena albidolilacea TaxID=1033008 RepID=A0AAD7EEG8_9AGAR|nr:hypothetical protein DFH08DRAFT_894858 [Mycena albidolilacea]